MQRELARRWLIRDKYGGKNHPAYLRRDLARLSRGEPLDYIIGWKEFCGVHIDLSLRPLIPREETEYWVQQIIKDIKKTKNPKVLDLCAGSGAIGLAVLTQHPKAKVVFADLSSRALKQIKITLSQNSALKKHATVIKSNLLKNISGKFDFILSNPPYIPTARIKRLPKSVHNFEPTLALDGGVDGMFFIQKIIREAPLYLKQKAILAVEVDSAHATSAVGFARNYFRSITVAPDQYGRPRTLILQK